MIWQMMVAEDREDEESETVCQKPDVQQKTDW